MEDYAEPIKIYDIISNGQYLNWITSAYVKIMAGPGAKLDPAISFLVAPLCMLICCTSMQLNKTPAGYMATPNKGEVSFLLNILFIGKVECYRALEPYVRKSA